jgi:hypothetical protein
MYVPLQYCITSIYLLVRFFVFWHIFWIQGTYHRRNAGYGLGGWVELGEGGAQRTGPTIGQPVYPLFLRSAALGVLQAPNAKNI